MNNFGNNHLISFRNFIGFGYHIWNFYYRRIKITQLRINRSYDSCLFFSMLHTCLNVLIQHYVWFDIRLRHSHRYFKTRYIYSLRILTRPSVNNLTQAFPLDISVTRRHVSVSVKFCSISYESYVLDT